MKAKLDPFQKAAAESSFPNTLVVAGAGAGKTRVLIERIAQLVMHRKVHPTEIMALTFTRKAAQEMRKRLFERIGARAGGVRLGTIHALALQYVRMYGELLGYRSFNLSIYGP